MLRSIYLVRHGESVSNAGGITMPHALIPLTEAGRKQADVLSARLPAQPPRILASPLIRALDTAEPYAKRRQVKIEQEPLLQEFDMIDPVLIAGMDQAQRRPIADAFCKEGDPTKQMGEQAESFGHFASRVSAFMTDRLPLLPDGTVCFGHGIWIGMVAWKLLGFGVDTCDDMRRFRRFQTGLPLPNGAIYALEELAPAQWVLRSRFV